MVKYAAFLSHDRGKDSEGRDNHDRVVRMSRALHARGIHVWIDDAEMSGDIDTRVCAGIDQSALVLLFVTLNFMFKVGGKGPMGEADFCRLEFNYAKQKKTAAKMLCVVMDSECLKNANWSGPVQMHMGGSLFFDFTTDDNFDVKVENLIAMMRSIAAPADWENVTLQPLEKSNHCGQLIEFLSCNNLGRIAQKICDKLEMDTTESLVYLEQSEIDNLDLQLWQRKKLSELVNLVKLDVAGAVSLKERDLNDSDLSGADTSSEGGDAVSGSEDDVDCGWESVVIKHPGNTEDFQEHMRGFIQTFLDHTFEIECEIDESAETFSNVLYLPEGEWTFCMFLWMCFAKNAELDQSSQNLWRECIQKPAQQTLLARLDWCLKQESTRHKLWSRSDLKSNCSKEFAAAIYVTDVMVRHHLKGHAESIGIWESDVVKGWFENDEGALAILLRANKFLREHLVDGIQIIEHVIKTQSYVAFLRMSKLASLLLFEYLEVRKLEDNSSSGPAGSESLIFQGFSMFISSSNRIFSLTVQDVPARRVMPMVRQGLKCLARLSAEAWEMMGPVRTAKDYLYGLATPSISAGQETMPWANAKSLMKFKGGCDDMNGASGSDDEFRLNKVREVGGIYDDADARALIQTYLEELRKTWGYYIDSASGEKRLVDTVYGQSISLLLFKESFSSFYEKCSEGDAATQEQLTCPISITIMKDPVKCSDGHTYERSEISDLFERALESNEPCVSPITRKNLHAQHGDVRIEWCESNRYGDAKKVWCQTNQEILEKITKFMEEKDAWLEELNKSAEGEEERRIFRSRLGHDRCDGDSAGSSKEGTINPGQEFSSADNFLQMFLHKKHPLRLACLTGPPASGKTITMQQLVCTHAASVAIRTEKMLQGENDGTIPSLHAPLLPLFMRAAELSKLLSDTGKRVKTMIDLVELFINESIHRGLFNAGVNSQILKLFEHDRLVVFIDGLDEAAQHQELLECIIDAEVKKRRNFHILISTREHSYRHSRGCKRLGEFAVVNMQPLDEKCQVAMIKDGRIPSDQVDIFRQRLAEVADKHPELATSPFLLSVIIEVYKKEGVIPTQRVELYAKVVDASVFRCVAAKLQPLDEDRRLAMIQDGRIQSDKVATFLQLLEDMAVKTPELASSPFLLSLLIDVYKKEAAKPKQRVELYVKEVELILARCIPGRLGRKIGELETDEPALEIANRYLETLAFESQIRRRKRDFRLTEFGILFSGWLSLAGLDWSHTQDVLSCARELVFGQPIVGLLTCVGDNAYRFSHLTLQEYLAAKCLVRLYEKDPQKLLDELQPLYSSWKRMVLQFAACLLKSEEIFESFCRLVLDSDDGTGLHCELVHDFLKERRASEKGEQKVEQMVREKLQENRGTDYLIAGLCHPSLEMRNLVLSQMKKFGVPPNPFAQTDGVIKVLKQTAEDDVCRWHERAAAILSMAQLAQMDHCRKSNGRSDTLRWLLGMLKSNRTEDIRFAIVKGLGILLKGSEERPKGDEDMPVNKNEEVLLDDKNEEVLLDDKGEEVLVETLESWERSWERKALGSLVEAVADLKAFSDGLMDWVLSESTFIADGIWPMRHLLLVFCNKIAISGNQDRAAKLVRHLFCRVHAATQDTFNKEKGAVLEALEKMFQLFRVDSLGSQLFLPMLMSGGVKQRSRVIKVAAEISMHFLRESRESLDKLAQALLSDAVEGCSFADLLQGGSLLADLLKDESKLNQTNLRQSSDVFRYLAESLGPVADQGLAAPKRVVNFLAEFDKSQAEQKQRQEKLREEATKRKELVREMGKAESAELWAGREKEKSESAVSSAISAEVASTSVSAIEHFSLEHLAVTVEKFTPEDLKKGSDGHAWPLSLYCATRLWASSGLMQERKTKDIADSLSLSETPAKNGEEAFKNLLAMKEPWLPGHGQKGVKWVQNLSEIMRNETRCLGRLLFTSCLEYIRARQMSMNDSSMEEIEEWVIQWKPSDARSRLEQQFLLKEVRIGRRLQELPSWTGLVSEELGEVGINEDSGEGSGGGSDDDQGSDDDGGDDDSVGAPRDSAAEAEAFFTQSTDHPRSSTEKKDDVWSELEKLLMKDVEETKSPFSKYSDFSRACAKPPPLEAELVLPALYRAPTLMQESSTLMLTPQEGEEASSSPRVEDDLKELNSFRKKKVFFMIDAKPTEAAAAAVAPAGGCLLSGAALFEATVDQPSKRFNIEDAPSTRFDIQDSPKDDTQQIAKVVEADETPTVQERERLTRQSVESDETPTVHDLVNQDVYSMDIHEAGRGIRILQDRIRELEGAGRQGSVQHTAAASDTSSAASADSKFSERYSPDIGEIEDARGGGLLQHLGRRSSSKGSGEQVCTQSRRQTHMSHPPNPPVVKSPHELVCMGLDLRLCACTHLVKQEASLVKDAIVEAYVAYASKVLEYEHAEKQRIRQEQADEAALQQAQGGIRKKGRREEEGHELALRAYSGGLLDSAFGFSEEEADEVSLEQRAEEDFEGGRVARATELRKQAALVFSEYRQYSRIQLAANRGWDQYLPKAPEAQSAAPVITAASAPVGVDAGQPEQPPASSFFVPRSVTAAPGPVPPALPTVAVGLNEAPAVQYDLMADLLHANMFKVLSDMLRSESLRIQQCKSAKFGYLPMMAVATLGALNAESFCEHVLSCLKLVVSDLHVSLKAEEIRMLVMLRMNRGFMEYMRASYPDTPLSEFKVADTYVRAHGGVGGLDDDEDDEDDE